MYLVYQNLSYHLLFIKNYKIFLITIAFLTLRNSIAYASNAGYEYRIGTLYPKDSVQWLSLQHAIDNWNNQNAVKHEFSLNLIAPSSQYFLTIEDKFCDIIQYAISAIIFPITNNSKEDLMLRSMCHHFKIPCFSIRDIENIEQESNMFFSMSPPLSIIPNAIKELISSLRWPSYVIIFQSDNDLKDVADLFSKYYKIDQLMTSSKILRLPKEQENYGVFFKFIREKIKETNIVFHANDISLIHTFLAQASYMNMTESKFSYIFTNPDLCLLDEFFNNMKKIYLCNITGLQMVLTEPPMRSDMAMIMDAVDIIGFALVKIREENDDFSPKSLICDAGDSWDNGIILSNIIRNFHLPLGHTGPVSFDFFGRRKDFMIHGITKKSETFVKVRFYSDNI
uniref:ANF_receptor domain-containing protein n=1 Tax=Parastrongyloides trichosuri TaxID=131310 RepID=A0A0N4ZCP0_PARTI